MLRLTCVHNLVVLSEELYLILRNFNYVNIYLSFQQRKYPARISSSITTRFTTDPSMRYTLTYEFLPSTGTCTMST